MPLSPEVEQWFREQYGRDISPGSAGIPAASGGGFSIRPYEEVFGPGGGAYGELARSQGWEPGNTGVGGPTQISPNKSPYEPTLTPDESQNMSQEEKLSRMKSLGAGAIASAGLAFAGRGSRGQTGVPPSRPTGAPGLAKLQLRASQTPGNKTGSGSVAKPRGMFNPSATGPGYKGPGGRVGDVNKGGRPSPGQVAQHASRTRQRDERTLGAPAGPSTRLEEIRRSPGSPGPNNPAPSPPGAGGPPPRRGGAPVGPTPQSIAGPEGDQMFKRMKGDAQKELTRRAGDEQLRAGVAKVGQEQLGEGVAKMKTEQAIRPNYQTEIDDMIQRFTDAGMTAAQIANLLRQQQIL